MCRKILFSVFVLLNYSQLLVITLLKISYIPAYSFACVLCFNWIETIASALHRGIQLDIKLKLCYFGV